MIIKKSFNDGIILLLGLMAIAFFLNALAVNYQMGDLVQAVNQLSNRTRVVEMVLATPKMPETVPAPVVEATPTMSPMLFATSQEQMDFYLTHVGQCTNTTVTATSTRIGDATYGLQIFYADGGDQVTYDDTPSIEHSRIGDSVRVCLMSIPTDCPAGDTRGKVLKATNLRTDESWEALSTEHICGGA